MNRDYDICIVVSGTVYNIEIFDRFCRGTKINPPSPDPNVPKFGKRDMSFQYLTSDVPTDAELCGVINLSDTCRLYRLWSDIDVAAALYFVKLAGIFTGLDLYCYQVANGVKVSAIFYEGDHCYACTAVDESGNIGRFRIDTKDPMISLAFRVYGNVSRKSFKARCALDPNYAEGRLDRIMVSSSHGTDPVAFFSKDPVSCYPERKLFLTGTAEQISNYLKAKTEPTNHSSLVSIILREDAMEIIPLFRNVKFDEPDYYNDISILLMAIKTYRQNLIIPIITIFPSYLYQKDCDNNGVLQYCIFVGEFLHFRIFFRAFMKAEGRSVIPEEIRGHLDGTLTYALDFGNCEISQFIIEEVKSNQDKLIATLLHNESN